jgi:serine protease Do
MKTEDFPIRHHICIILYIIIISFLTATVVLYTGAFGSIKSTEQVVRTVKKGTVFIENKLDTTNGGIGTGFIIGENLIVTNDHVIEGNGKLTVVSANDQTRYEAEVISTDAIVDIAILKLKKWDEFKKHEGAVILPIGDSREMEEGSKVVIIGHPWGLTWTVSEGIMSSKNRRVGSNPKYVDQVDAKIFQGNSGGPVFNEQGEVICVSELMFEGKGGSYGFCIPSVLLKKVLGDFQLFGEVRWRAMNVSIGLTDDGNYAIVNSIDENGAADKAGIKVGDKILEIYTPNNHPTGLKITDVNSLVSEMATISGADEKIKVLIERNGEKQMIDVITNYKLSKEYEPDKSK